MLDFVVTILYTISRDEGCGCLTKMKLKERRDLDNLSEHDSLQRDCRASYVHFVTLTLISYLFIITFHLAVYTLLRMNCTTKCSSEIIVYNIARRISRLLI